MKKPHIIVIGGGLSGLTAAYRIQSDIENVDVTVLEANVYPGGRMLTTDFGGEAGGESIGFYYGALQEIAKEVDIEIDAAPMTVLNKSFNIAYYFEEFKEWVEQKDWAQWKNNPLPPQMRALPPIMLLRDYVNRIQQPDFDTLLDDPKMREIAGQSLLDFLRSQNAPDEVLPFIESNFEVNDDLSKLSALTSVLKTWITQPMMNSKYYYVKGGNQELPKRLASRLRQVHFNKRVESVKKTNTDQHEIQTTDGSKYICDYVIFALPVGPMKQIAIDPPLQGLQKEAFDQIRYTPSMKIFFRVKKKFWEEDQLPIFMWTNTEINFVIPVYDKDTRENPLSGPKLWGLYAIANGVRAKQLNDIRKNGGDIGTHCQSILERIRPAMKDALEFEEIVDWGNNKTALGAFHFFEPNQRIVDYYKHIANPSHRRHFACEHTEYKYKGFEAAAQAGLRSAREIARDIVNKRVLIIGCGNLGTVLAKQWHARYYDTRVTTTTPSKKKALAEIADDVTVLKVDNQPENIKALETAMSDRDVVVCLVGPVPGKAMTPQEIQDHYTENLLRPAQIITDILKKRRESAPHIIFSSSLSVYGTGDQTQGNLLTEETETSPCNPSASLYDAAEKVYLESGLPVTILRLGALYDRDKNAFANQARMAVEKMGGISPFDPEGLLNKIGMWDAANAIDFVVKGKHYGVFNVCDEEQVAIKQFFDHLCEQQDLKPIQHMGMIKGVRKAISHNKIRVLGFNLTPPHLLVIGAGELSSYLVPAALKQGYRVTMTTTTSEKVERLREQYDNKVEILVVEGGNPQAVAHAMEDKDMVVIAVAPRKDRLKGLTFDEHFYQVFGETYKGTAQNVVKSWQKMTYKPQVIYVSAHSVYPNTNGELVDENTYPLPRHRVSSTLREAESTILDWIPDSTVLRMGWLLSEARNWEKTLHLWKKFLPNYEIPGKNDTVANMVHIEDAVDSILYCLNKKLTGKYNVCNDAHPTWGKLWGDVAQLLEIEPPKWNNQVNDEWFEGNHTVSNQKIKDAGFKFKYPDETGWTFLKKPLQKPELEHLQSAMITAWVRSIESNKKDRLFNDPFAEQLSNRPNLEFLSVRTKLFDQELLKAVSTLKADCQIVILGAGMDTRALRLEVLSSIPVFEIDLPLVVSTKKQLMVQHQITRDNYAQIEADLEDDEWPQLLKNAGFQDAMPTIWLAEGLLTYLDSNNAIELFKKMHSISATTSVVLADIPDQSAAGKNNRIRFTCDNPSTWFGKSGWTSVEAILPKSNADLQRQYESVNQQISLFRAVKKKTVLIVGCGYFGTQLLETLSASDQHMVMATTTTAERTDKLIAQGAAEAVVWDGTKSNGIKSLIEKTDVVVVSLRSLTHDNEKILAALKQISTLLQPSQHLVLVSSIEVYPGDIYEAKEEDSSTQKIQYAMENVFAEHMSKCIIRIGQLYGAGTDPHGLSRNMKGHLEKIMAITSGVLPGDGTQPVFLTHVQDLVGFAEYVVDKNLKGTFNICNTLNCNRKIFYETLCDYYKVKRIHWSQNTENIKHMLLPKVINTHRLQQLSFSLDESHYEIESILEE